MRKRGVLFVAAWMAVAVTLCSAQAPTDAGLSFEVATIKPNSPGAFVPTRGRNFSMKAQTVKSLMRYSYDLQTKQLEGGPDWLDKERFDIAGVPVMQEEPTTAQWKLMLQKLLVDRFKLTFRQESREMPVFILSVAKDGPKMAKNTSGGSSGLNMAISGGVKLYAQNVTMAELL